MSYEKMEVVNPAEKEASEVLHSLLSVERRSVDSKEAIIVTLPSDQNGGGEYGEGAQWHTPMGQHSVFEMSSQGIQQHNFNGHQEQVYLFLLLNVFVGVMASGSSDAKQWSLPITTATPHSDASITATSQNRWIYLVYMVFSIINAKPYVYLLQQLNWFQLNLEERLFIYRLLFIPIPREGNWKHIFQINE